MTFLQILLHSKKTIQVKKATAGSTTLTNTAEFEQGDSTLDNIAVTPDQFSQPFHITNAEKQSGHKLMDLMKINFRALANKIIDTALAPVTNANFGADTVDVAKYSF